MSGAAWRGRGATLIELLVSAAVLGIILAIAVSTLLGMRTVFHTAQLKRQTAATVREAVRAIERDLRLVGYGIEPALAFDFTIYEGAGAYCGAVPGGPVAQNPCPARRDRIDGPDELVFYARNPGYWGGDLAGEPEGRAWGLLGAAADAVTLSAHGGETLGRGQVLQLVCSGGTTSAYVRVSQTTSAGGGGPLYLPVEPAVAGDPFTQRADEFWATCGGMARAFRVDRFRYFVDPAAVLADGSTAPFLMLDQGVDRNGDGLVDRRDLIPVAPGIADLQVSYVRPEPAPVAVGASPGTALAWCSGAERPLTGPAACAGGLRVVDFTAGEGAGDYPSYSYITVAAGAGLRRGADAANVSAVQVAVVGRSITRAPVRGSPPLLLNRTVLQPGEADQPFVFQSAQLLVGTPNLQARGLTFQ